MPAAQDVLSVRSYGASHGSHDHDHFQILIGLHGTLELEVSGRGRRIAAGDGCVVPPGERHDFEARSGARCLVLDSQMGGWARVTSAPPPAALALAQYLSRACTERLPRARQLGPTLLLEAWVPTVLLVPQRARRTIDWEGLAHWALARGPGTTVAEVATRAHLSAAQLAARCLAEQGQSTQQWLRELRLTQARAWLEQGLSVSESARRSGYRSPSALTAAQRRARR
jgi:AraC-like DNA-binding protein